MEKQRERDKQFEAWWLEDINEDHDDLNIHELAAVVRIAKRAYEAGSAAPPVGMAGLRELVAKWRDLRGCDWSREPDGWKVSFNVCADALEAFLASTAAERWEELMAAKKSGFEDGLRWARSNPEYASTAEVAPQATGTQGRPTLTFGDGDYSCATCGLGMREPCEHWKRFLAQAPAPAVAGASPQEISHHIWCKSLLKMDLPCNCGRGEQAGAAEPDIITWLDDNLANEEDAPFERRAELIQKALTAYAEKRHHALLEAIDWVIEWEQDYRTRNNLGKNPPMVFIHLAKKAAALRQSAGRAGE